MRRYAEFRGCEIESRGLYLMAKSKGKPLSQVDLMLAALGTVKKFTVLTADKDSVVFPKVRTEDWT